MITSVMMGRAEPEFFGDEEADSLLVKSLSFDGGAYYFGSFVRELFVGNMGLLSLLPDLDVAAVRGEDRGYLDELLGLGREVGREDRGLVARSRHRVAGKAVDLMEVGSGEESVTQMIFSSTFAHERLHAHAGTFRFDGELFGSPRRLREDILGKVARVPPPESNPGAFFNSEAGRVSHAMKLARRGWTLVNENG